MRLHILSNLHLELGDFTPPDTGADAAILAGDIHVQEHGIDWAVKHFSVPVYYVLGNYEFYGGHLDRMVKRLKQKATGTNVHVLECDEAIQDNVRFLGGTCWTDFSATGNLKLAMAEARRTMSDYREIRAGMGLRKLRPEDTQKKHTEFKAWLRKKLNEPFDGKTVVITHHAPSILSIAPEYLDEFTHGSAAYVNRMEHLMGKPIALWVHGQTHSKFDYKIAGTHVVCNPRGYHGLRLNKKFDPALVVEI